MNIIAPFLLNLAWCAVLLLLAPLCLGLREGLTSRLSGRSGRSVLAPYTKLIGLVRRDDAVSAAGTDVQLYAPIVALAATATAATMVGELAAPSAPFAAMCGLIGCLSLARLSICLGAFDTVEPRAVRAAAQQLVPAVMIEPSLLFALCAVAIASESQPRQLAPMMLAGFGFALAILVSNDHGGLRSVGRTNRGEVDILEAYAAGRLAMVGLAMELRQLLLWTVWVVVFVQTAPGQLLLPTILLAVVLYVVFGVIHDMATVRYDLRIDGARRTALALSVGALLFVFVMGSGV